MVNGLVMEVVIIRTGAWQKVAQSHVTGEEARVKIHPVRVIRVKIRLVRGEADRAQQGADRAPIEEGAPVKDQQMSNKITHYD